MSELPRLLYDKCWLVLMYEYVNGNAKGPARLCNGVQDDTFQV